MKLSDYIKLIIHRKLELFGLALFISFALVFPTQANLKPDEIGITISNIPQGTSSLFIPLKSSSQLLELYSGTVKDSFFHGCLTKIERTKDHNLLGLSIVSLNKGDLPYTIEVILKYGKSSRSLPAREDRDRKERIAPQVNELGHNNTLVENMANPLTGDRRPMIVNPAVPANKKELASLSWDEPWVYTQITHEVTSGAAGFTEIQIDSKDKAKKVRPKTPQSSQADTFHISTFGQTLTQTKTTQATEDYQAPFQLDRPAIKSLRFFVYTPAVEKYRSLYIPLRLNNPEALKFSLGDQIFNAGYSMRLASQNIIEFRGVEQKDLPSGQVLTGELLLSQDHLVPENGILVGPVLSEPAIVVSGVEVVISPSAVPLDRSFDVKEFFLLK